MQNPPFFRYRKGRNRPKEGGVTLDLHQLKLKGSILFLAALLIGLTGWHDRSRGRILEVRSRSSLTAQRKALQTQKVFWRNLAVAPLGFNPQKTNAIAE